MLLHHTESNTAQRITSSAPARLQLSRRECEEVFQREGSEIQPRVQLCPAVLSSQGSTTWARDARAG